MKMLALTRISSEDNLDTGVGEAAAFTPAT
jgi:hypothetical protein